MRTVSPWRPTISYLICTTPRSGSWLLADAMRATGVAGRPEEYLRTDWLRRYQVDGGLTYEHQLRGLGPVAPAAGFLGFLAAVLGVGTTDNGVFGVKVHQDQFAAAVAAAAVDAADIETDVDFVRAWLARPRFVHLTRGNRVRQALSHYRARRSGIWARLDDAVEPAVRMDFAEVDAIIDRNITRDAQWISFFARAGVEPIRVTYEDLVADYGGTVRETLRSLALPGPLPAIPPPVLRKQSDAWTDEQVEAYEHYRRCSTCRARQAGRSS
jgi:trehalose 2-sulfotransferase